MDPTNPVFCREAAARCRKTARSSTDPKEWIAMAEQWEWLADTADGSWLLSSKGHPDSGKLLDLKTIATSAPAVSSAAVARKGWLSQMGT
jgi:hypothetical protein